MKIFLVYANENWIVDRFAKEWIGYNKNLYTNNIYECDIIWILSDYVYDRIPLQLLQNKKVITTYHHITPWKLDKNKINKINIIDSFTDYYHVICNKTKDIIQKFTKKKIIVQPFWVNENDWFQISNKKKLRKKYNINSDSYLIGSFQRDTEGNSIQNKTFKPKLEKGPDIFCKGVQLLKSKVNNLEVLLTGWRRQFIMRELDKLKIKYYYLEMVNLKELNELYNCLDLYLVSSRVEGGPRAILECAMNKVPLISTNVGIAEEILDKKSIYDGENISTILKAKHNIEYSYKNVSTLKIENYMKKFNQDLFKI